MGRLGKIDVVKILLDLPKSSLNSSIDVGIYLAFVCDITLLTETGGRSLHRGLSATDAVYICEPGRTGSGTGSTEIQKKFNSTVTDLYQLYVDSPNA